MREREGQRRGRETTLSRLRAQHRVQHEAPSLGPEIMA